jgi:hypothetical protein
MDEMLKITLVYWGYTQTAMHLYDIKMFPFAQSFLRTLNEVDLIGALFWLRDRSSIAAFISLPPLGRWFFLFPTDLLPAPNPMD